MELNEALRKTREVAEAIDRKKGIRWDAKIMFINLVEEVGELANALIVEHGNKPEKRRKYDLTDSVCDILYALLMIAALYRIDLDREYQKVLNEIKERGEKGEFSD